MKHNGPPCPANFGLAAGYGRHDSATRYTGSIERWEWWCWEAELYHKRLRFSDGNNDLEPPSVALRSHKCHTFCFLLHSGTRVPR